MISSHPSSEWYRSLPAAERYARLAQGGDFPLYRVFARQNIDYASPPRTGLLVDGFAGTGLVTQLLREGGWQNEIVLIDKSSEMLDKAKEFLGESRMRFIATDMLEISAVVQDASSVIASQGAHRIEDDRGGLPALLESVYRAMEPGGAFVFNLDSTSIRVDGVTPLYDIEPYRIFFGEILQDVVRSSGGTNGFVEELTHQFSRFTIDTVLRFIEESPFREGSYLVMQTELSREVLEMVHFRLGAPQMLALSDTLIDVAIERMRSHHAYQQSWRGRSAVPWHSVVFRAVRPRS